MKILVLDIAASKTGALSVLKDFYGYVREHSCEGSDEASSSIVKDKSILPSAVEPPADAPGLSGEDAAEAAKIRRRKRQSKKNFVVSYNLCNIICACMEFYVILHLCRLTEAVN